MGTRTSQTNSGRWRLSRRGALLVAVVAAIVIVGGFTAAYTRAETYPGGTDNGLTSHIATLNSTLTGLGYGATTDTPDWGSNWNRIKTSAVWSPSGTVTSSDVRAGKTFYNGSRTQQTGTNRTGYCPTEAYHDSYGAPVTQTTNCTAQNTWTVPSDGIAGTDKLDPVSGLIWSQPLWLSGSTPTFSGSSTTTWTWDASGANNVTAGTRTAIQLCSDRGNGWRLPTQKELMQAYIDGSYFNLNQPSSYFWSATEISSTNAWVVTLGSGNTYNGTKTSTYAVRCVR